MIALQTTADLHNVMTITDATITGVLTSIVIAFGATIIYLYKSIQTLNREYVASYQELSEKYIDELRKNNEILLKVNNSYNDFSNNMLKIFDKK